MFVFSSSPEVADAQIQAILFYLTTFGYVDGQLTVGERDFLLDYIQRLARWRAAADIGNRQVRDDARHELERRYLSTFQQHFNTIHRYVRDLFNEPIAGEDDPQQYVLFKLKLRCFEIFAKFDRDNQKQMLATVDDLITADGVVHPAEEKFRRELLQLLKKENPYRSLEVEAVERRPKVERTAKVVQQVDDHAFFGQLETHYARDSDVRARQVGADEKLIRNAMTVLGNLRRPGLGKLRGVQDVRELRGLEPFLDRHIYAILPDRSQRYELIVLGDLHGCYSCLKAALLQSDFVRKVRAFKENPQHNPDVKLVLLGDYIDRGKYNYNGVLRLVLYLLQSYPRHVITLRGNHEYYVEKDGQVISGVLPAEAIYSMLAHLPGGQFRLYKQLFESLPNMLIFDRMLFVHAGIPRDEDLDNAWLDLSSLNGDKLRFQMLWSDPSEVEFIPAELQKANTRFPFGMAQFRRFMSQTGLITLVRGHEQIDEGFKLVYDLDGMRLYTLFSAGGERNEDLPEDSSYRSVQPKALTVAYDRGSVTMTPWNIDYERYLEPTLNAFYHSPPEL